MFIEFLLPAWQVLHDMDGFSMFQQYLPADNQSLQEILSVK